MSEKKSILDQTALLLTEDLLKSDCENGKTIDEFFAKYKWKKFSSVEKNTDHAPSESQFEELLNQRTPGGSQTDVSFPNTEKTDQAATNTLHETPRAPKNGDETKREAGKERHTRRDAGEETQRMFFEEEAEKETDASSDGTESDGDENMEGFIAEEEPEATESSHMVLKHKKCMEEDMRKINELAMRFAKRPSSSYHPSQDSLFADEERKKSPSDIFRGITKEDGSETESDLSGDDLLPGVSTEDKPAFSAHISSQLENEEDCLEDAFDSLR
ncbi:MAG: uncharacterized protein A8A55_0875 [Amphiamblys sp. WSBS2006]|nr:MAG: uncharacterized protein A8A55_0875 [Amphiamblys sp. WSBS2006]